MSVAEMNEVLTLLWLFVLIKVLVVGVALAVINFVDPAWWKN
jgi:hypothetical protein